MIIALTPKAATWRQESIMGSMFLMRLLLLHFSHLLIPKIRGNIGHYEQEGAHGKKYDAAPVDVSADGWCHEWNHRK